MTIQVLFLTLLAFQAQAATEPSCFDFSTQVTSPLRATNDTPSKISGRLDSGPVWALVSDWLPGTPEQVLAELRKHEAMRSSRVKEMTIVPVPDPHYLDRQKVKFVIKPFPLISIDWTEEWAFTLLKGTEQAPERVLASYEKVAGTSHIEHLCGSIVVEKGNAKTRITLYEEAKATRRSERDELNGLTATVRSLSQAQTAHARGGATPGALQ